MKKQILTFAVCLALTTSSALATGTNVTSPQKPTATQSKIINTVSPKQCSHKPCMSRDEAKKNFEQKMNKERELMYNALNLTEEQRKKAEELHQKNKTEAKALFKKVHTQRVKLDELINKKASAWEIWKQEAVLKAAKKDIKEHMKASKKEFNAILTKEQQSKLKVIDAEREARMKEFKKTHKGDFKKGKGPKPPFGPEEMGPPPAGSQEMDPAPLNKKGEAEPPYPPKK